MGKNIAYKDSTPEELTASLAEKKRELMNLRFRIATRSLDKSHTISLVKKEIARISTLLNQKKCGK